MRNTVMVLIALSLVIASCAANKVARKPRPPMPLFAAHTATLDITNGINLVASISLPSGFTPNPAWPPMWLQQGTEVAVAGAIGDQTVMIGFSGARLATQRKIGEDFGPFAPGGRIADIAASPDGMELAATVVEPINNRLEVVMSEVLGSGEGHPVASFDGDFRAARLAWLDRSTIALTLRAPTPEPEQPFVAAGSVANPGGLYVIGITGLGSIRHFDKIRCPLARLSFSPNRHFAISEGDDAAAPAIIDLRAQACFALQSGGPVKVLGWAADSSSVIYAASGANGLRGVYRYELATGAVSLVAVSSAAAAIASDGAIIAIGNNQLSWKRIAQAPAAPVIVQVAILSSQNRSITINSLGFKTTPAMLAQYSMDFSAVSDSGAIDAIIPGAAGPLRELIDYSYPARAAFVVASGPARGPIVTSWSPDGRELAMIDGDASLAMLTVMRPPR